MKYTISFFLTIWAITSFGTSVDWRPIAVITKSADHVFVGKVTKVDYKDENGNILGEGNTGPGLDAEIRVHIQVDQSLVYKTNAQKIPDTLIVTYWNKFHYRVRQFKPDEGKSFIFCLKGDSFERVYAAHWKYSLSYKEDVLMSIRGEVAQAELTGILRIEVVEKEMHDITESYFLKIDGQKNEISLRGEIATMRLWNLDGKRIWIKGHLLTEKTPKRSLGLPDNADWRYFLVVRDVKKISSGFEIPQEETKAEPEP